MGATDFHTHIFPPEIIRERESLCRRDDAFGRLYENPRSPMADAEDLEAYLYAASLDMAVACSFGFADQGLLRSCNDYILQAARRNPRIVPFAAVSERGGRAPEKESERCLGLGARGIGEIGFYVNGLGAPERRRLDRLAGTVMEAGAILMLHMNEQIGHSYAGKAAIDFGEVAEFLSAHGALTVVLAHLGGGLCFYEFMPEIRKAFKNVYYDTAAVPFLYGVEVYRFLGRFLAKKTLFGSDFPLLRRGRYEEGLSMLGAKAKAKVMGLNAGRLLGA